MAVNLSPPNQLGFPRPLTQIVKRSLLIHNPNPQPVAFKVKTTAPKQYCVRPNQGRVEPGENVEVQIVLQALPADPPPHAKCKDKFLVQSAFIPPDEEMHSLPEMWAQVERTNKASIHEQKIRCAYLSAEDGTGNPNGIPEENEDSMSPIDHSRMDESHMANSKGYTQYTTIEERSFDPALFVNGGRTHWVLEEKPKPAAQEAVPPRKQPVPLPKLRPSSFVAPFVTPSDEKDLPKNVALVQPGGQNLIVYQLSGIYSQAETDAAGSPVSKQFGTLNGGNKDLPSTPSHGSSNAAAIGAGALGAGALGAGATAVGSSHALNNSGTTSTGREIPSLSAADVAAAGSPTNAALERSLNATTSDSEKLRIVLQENESLRSQLSALQNAAPVASGLRKRGGAGADVTGTKTAMATAPTQAASGVPLEVCAGLVFAVFVLTYLFF